jgi:hypothetical protein
VIRNPIRFDRIAGIVTLLGALTTGHSAFADTVNFSGTQVYAAATLPPFAAGLGALGLLGWRKKRNAGAIDRIRAPYVSIDKLEALLTKKSVDVYVICERWLGGDRLEEGAGVVRDHTFFPPREPVDQPV